MRPCWSSSCWGFSSSSWWSQSFFFGEANRTLAINNGHHPAATGTSANGEASAMSPRMGFIASPAKVQRFAPPALLGVDALVDLAEPCPMVLPRPTRRHPAARHGSYRSFHPDAGIDVDDDRGDQDEREKSVQQSPGPDHTDGKERREQDPPNQDAGEQQADQADHQGEEQQLLSGVVASDVRQIFLVISDHILDFTQPDPVARLHEIVAPEVHAEQIERRNHDAPNERMQDSRPGSAAEQIGQPKERGMKQREPGQREQHEADRDDPVVDARAGGITHDTVGIRWIHGVFSDSRRAASSSPSSVSLGPIPM